MSKTFDYNLVLTILGIVLTVGGFTLSNYYIIGFGIIALLLYIGIYINEQFYGRMKRIEDQVSIIAKDINTEREINQIKERISSIEGQMSVLKNKRGVLDPITLLIIIIVIVMIILWLKQKGIL